MSTTAQKTVNTAGYGFAFIVMLLVLVVAMLFLIPGSSLFGVSSVDGRTSYTTYLASNNSDVEDLLKCRNLIIESRSIDVKILVGKSGQLDENSIQIWDNSTGLTFNSIKRTHVDWEQIIIEKEMEDGTFVGEVYYKLIITEPSGIISRDACVYVIYPMETIAASHAKAYNFFLNTGSSSVSFSSDDFEEEGFTYNWLNVDTVTVGNATGKITFPERENEGDFYVEVGKIVVIGNNAEVDNKEATVEGGVDVSGDNVKLSLGEVEGDINVTGDKVTLSVGDVAGDITIEARTGTITVGSVGGSVNIKGSINFNQRTNSGVVAGNVDFRGDNGKVEINGCDELYVDTKNADIRIRQKCSKITFAATENGKLYAGQVGDADRLIVLGSYVNHESPYDSNVIVKWGSVELLNVWCDVFVDMYGSAALKVDFAVGIYDSTKPETRMPRLKTLTYDGVANLNNICGEVNVFVRANGKGIVNADFARVFGNSVIKYDGSSLPTTTAGNVKVTFIVDISYCRLIVWHNRSGRNNGANVLTGPDPLESTVSSNNGMLNNNGAVYHVNKASYSTGDIFGNLEVYTSNSLNVVSR